MQFFIISLISLYQKILSPDHGLFQNARGTLHCRFYPSCSAYAAESLRLHGLGHGLFLSLLRIFRCHPWHPGGYDPIRGRKQRVVCGS